MNIFYGNDSYKEWGTDWADNKMKTAYCISLIKYN